MPIEKARTNKPASFSQPESTLAQNLNAGPYIGIVKNNVDPQRMGRLQVWVPFLAPDENNEGTWFTVSYATPFYGFTAPASDTNINEFDKTKHSYGMWFVPPDLGVRVLITFANGDPSKGYWFACIPEGHSHYMVPSVGSSSYTDFKTGNDAASVIPSDQRPDRVPVAEYNNNDKNLDSDPNWFQKSAKPLHREQFKKLQEQGLEFDYLRGSLLSSSQRESPSQTFGISTPGRPGTTTNGVASSRIGGHSFVLDDGDIYGDNNFVRLKTGGGHQILMHDSGEFIYISNSNGTAWVELNNNGDIELFGNGSISIRAADTLNLHADQNINMYAGAKITMVAEQGMAVQSKFLNLNSIEQTTIHSCQALNLKSGTVTVVDSGTSFSVNAPQNLTLVGGLLNLNSGSAPKIQPLDDIPRINHPNSLRSSGGFKSVPKRIQSIATRVPTHEPDVGHLAKMEQVRNPNAVAITPQDLNKIGNNEGRVPQSPVSVLTDTSGNPVLTQDGTTISTPGSSTDITTSATGSVPAQYQGLASYLQKQPDPASAVGTLTKDETKALFAGIGLSESAHNYAAVNQIGYIGKYQFGAAALVEQGYIKKEFYQMYGPGNSILDNAEAWTGKDGVVNKAGFLSSPAVQEKVMQGYTETNYNRMVKSGAIKATDDAATVGGMIQTAHLLGAGGANTWRTTGQGSDANNVSGTTYFNKGKYAIATLTKNGGLV